ncbi:extracellular solute-binding protein [Butyrivibrio sp. X503]|uniref:ABC transporter substrate-binding protein n=1 Tax=Butyrivibrio sp. X503 TaxID=2364878 RepID=UPI000EA92941|nr:ABC transporter substrate-binding protein [Butyrivibrio sp. X503]RKM57414.1 extracellular solute-binding protein [Butyrivibrio sp. X503]
MKNVKRILALVLTAAMAITAVACSDPTAQPDAGSTDAAVSKESGSYDQVTYAYCTFNNIPTEEDLDEVEEAINKITREKIGAEITLMPIQIFEYSSKINLALQGGEKIDIFESLGDFGSYVSTDMCYDITDMIDTYAPGAKEIVGDSWLEACKSNGVLYGIPTMKPIALTPMLIYRQDIADELNIDMSKVNSIEDVTSVLETVKAGHPDMIPLAAVQTGEIGLSTNYGEVDFLNDDRYKPIGVLMGDDLTVTDLYGTDRFKELCKLVRGWYNNGLVMQDAATTNSAAAETMSSGNYFGYLAAYSYPEEDTAVSLEAQVAGYDLGAKIIGDAYLSTSDINAITFMIASTTDVPEAALKFLDLTYTDPDVINLLIYGIEGRDYVKNADGSVSYPEGQDAATVPYTAQLSCGTLGNFFNMYQMGVANPESLQWELDQNKNAKTSPAMGFTFDSSNVKTQYTAVLNVISQYLPGLICGSLDPDTEIDKFIQALNDAGYQDILNEKQSQLDAWKASK